YSPQSTATVHSYGIPQDEAARIGTGSPDVASGTISNAAISFTYSAPAYSVSVISLSPTVVCAPTLSATSQLFPMSGGNGSVGISAGGGCGWTANSNNGWIVLTSGNGGSGNGVVNFAVGENLTGVSRQGTITIAAQTFTVTQDGGTIGECTYVISPTF